MSLDTFRRRHPAGTYVCCRRGHMFAIKDGKVFDWLNNTSRFDVLLSWEVTKA